MDGTTFFFDFEVAFMEWLQNFMGSVGVGLASFFTNFGEEIVLIGFLGLIYWCYDKEFGKMIGTSIVIGCVANSVVKNIVIRRRPYMDNAGISCLKPVDPEGDIYDISLQGYSFPSGHSQNAATIYGSLPLLKKKRITYTLAFLIPFLVGISRVALGVHYPTDVLAGWIIGATVLFVTFYIQKHVRRRWIFHLAVFVVSLSGIFVCRSHDYYSSLGMMAGLFLAMPFEERFVKFKNTKSIIQCVLRVVIGFALYLGLNTLMKLPFDPDMLANASAAAFAVRAVRYMILTFMIVGVYPLSFRLLDKFEKGKKE